jgi:hypothetical protein
MIMNTHSCKTFVLSFPCSIFSIQFQHIFWMFSKNPFAWWHHRSFAMKPCEILMQWNPVRSWWKKDLLIWKLSILKVCPVFSDCLILWVQNFRFNFSTFFQMFWTFSMYFFKCFEPSVCIFSNVLNLQYVCILFEGIFLFFTPSKCFQ